MTSAALDPHAPTAGSRRGVLATVKADRQPLLSPMTPFDDRAAAVIHVTIPKGRAESVSLLPT
ncbi:MAG: hypothetical protein WBB07_25390 [Mycobacterium sp.]